MGRPARAFSAETKIDREDWGLTWNQALEAGGWLVGKEIKLSIEIEAVLEVRLTRVLAGRGGWSESAVPSGLRHEVGRDHRGQPRPGSRPR